MKKRNSLHRLLAMLLAVLCCTIPMVSVSAAGDILDEADATTNSYTVDGINVYKDPYAASLHFTVEKLIYFTIDEETTMNDDRVMVVNTMESLITAAREYPFAALVVDAQAEPYLDRGAIVQLSKTQHIILIIGFDTARDDELATYERLTGNTTEKYVNMPGFAAYYVVSATGDIGLWDMTWGQDYSADDLLDFAECTKEGIFYLYDSFVLQEHPEFAEEINNAPVPQENIVPEDSAEPCADYIGIAHV